MGRLKFPSMGNCTKEFLDKAMSLIIGPRKSLWMFSISFQLEEEQLIREARIREASHQVGIPQERISVSSRAAQKYERDLEAARKEPELQPWQKKNILKSRTASQDRSQVDTEETRIVGELSSL